MRYKVGDKVVIRKYKDKYIPWREEVYKYVGKEYTIVEIYMKYYKMEGIRFLLGEEWIEDPFETLVRKLQ